MLIIKFSESENERIKREWLFKRKKKTDRGIKRENITVCGKVCTLVEINEKFILSNELQRLLKVFNGRIIGSPEALHKFVPEEYRFDFRSYFKRAVISSLINNFKNNLAEFCVCIRDADFDLLAEYADLARKTKRLVILCEENNKTSIFTQYCFTEYGVYVDFKNLNNVYSCNIFIDFSDIDETGKLLIKFNGKDTLIYPDPEYFIALKELSCVLKIGVPVKIACAAFETKSPAKINWGINLK